MTDAPDIELIAEPDFKEIDPRAALIFERLHGRPIVIVGMMGAGKTSVGRRLAQRLGFSFEDADLEIEKAAGMSIAEIFDVHGEAYFRAGEVRVILRMLETGTKVLATGGGAFMNEETREAIQKNSASIWLKADFDLLMRRVRKRATRPLLQTPDPEGTMKLLMERRYPVYAQADITVLSRDVPHQTMVSDVIDALSIHLENEAKKTP